MSLVAAVMAALRLVHRCFENSRAGRPERILKFDASGKVAEELRRWDSRMNLSI